MTGRMKQMETHKASLVTITLAAVEGRTELDLSGHGISQLPTEIGQLTNLQRLSLSDNPLTMLPESVLKRVAVFGVHPRTSSWGAPLSRDVLASLSMLLTYLRARILSAAGELTQAN